MGQKKINGEVRNKMKNLWNRMEKMEEYTHHENMIISGIRYEKDDDMDSLMSKMIGVATKLKTELKNEYINTAHRLPEYHYKMKLRIIIYYVEYIVLES